VITIPDVLYNGLMPSLRLMDAERAHGLAIRALSTGWVPTPPLYEDKALEIRVLGTIFRNPVGLAAGFDKDAVAIDGLARLGFGFLEAGTVTVFPQAGNPRPRLFRLTKDGAVINRMGFNNAGVEAFCERLAAVRRRLCPIGVNIGLNKEGSEPEKDYGALTAAVGRFADYITVNVSSPNTPGLRDLQSGARLRAILQSIAAAVPVRPPILIKLAPDLAESGLEAAIEVAMDEGVAGLIISNTTVQRPAGLTSPHRLQAGGLSGAPLFERSTAMLARVARLTRGRLVLIGCGGIRSGDDVLTKIKAGASLVQIYTSFSYEGPPLLGRMKRELSAALRREGFGSIQDAVGAEI
jgi:dihydroorotate dehydrogenase